jgi:hypothetical protein
MAGPTLWSGWTPCCSREERCSRRRWGVWLHTYPRVLGYTFKPVSSGTATATGAPHRRGSEQHLQRAGCYLDTPADNRTTALGVPCFAFARFRDGSTFPS